MAYEFCPAKCGKKFITKEHAERHADKEHHDWKTPKQKGWLTPYGFSDFSYPVTYEQACEAMKVLSDQYTAPPHTFGKSCRIEEVYPPETLEKLRKLREEIL